MICWWISSGEISPSTTRRVVSGWTTTGDIQRSSFSMPKTWAIRAASLSTVLPWNLTGLGPRGFIKPTRRYFFRARCIRPIHVVVLPQFCPVAAMKIFFAMIVSLVGHSIKNQRYISYYSIFLHLIYARGSRRQNLTTPLLGKEGTGAAQRGR